MLDNYTLQECRKYSDVLETKIKNLEHAINETEKIIKEAQMNNASISFLRKKIADSYQDLEILYVIKRESGIGN